jgi:hypothetical protein
MPLLERLARSQSGTLVTDITAGHVGKVLCVAFDKNFVLCGEDHVYVSHHVLLPPLLTDISQRIYMWDTSQHVSLSCGRRSQPRVPHALALSSELPPGLPCHS